MRNSTQIFELIKKVANDDERILAVYMNGSRVNPNVPKDEYQDYDVVFVTSDTKPFINNKEFILKFGNLSYMQLPDESPFFPNDKENSYGYLVQFDDGVRIDLTIQSVKYALEHIKDDTLCKILLDKKSILPEIPESSDLIYWVQKPSEEEFKACCNEFWWCSNNLAKGLARKEILYVQDMTNFVVRKELEKMLGWKVGIKTNFSVSVGKSSKYISNWLSKEEYDEYLKTYFSCDILEAKKSIFLMCDLFDKVAREVSQKLNFEYDEIEAKNAGNHLKKLNS